jgi:hypothetical protein
MAELVTKASRDEIAGLGQRRGDRPGAGNEEANRTFAVLIEHREFLALATPSGTGDQAIPMGFGSHGFRT